MSVTSLSGNLIVDILSLAHVFHFFTSNFTTRIVRTRSIQDRGKSLPVSKLSSEEVFLSTGTRLCTKNRSSVTIFAFSDFPASERERETFTNVLSHKYWRYILPFYLFRSTGARVLYTIFASIYFDVKVER